MNKGSIFVTYSQYINLPFLLERPLKWCFSSAEMLTSSKYDKFLRLSTT